MWIYAHQRVYYITDASALYYITDASALLLQWVNNFRRGCMADIHVKASPQSHTLANFSLPSSDDCTGCSIIKTCLPGVITWRIRVSNKRDSLGMYVCNDRMTPCWMHPGVIEMTDKKIMNVHLESAPVIAAHVFVVIVHQ